MKTVCKKLLSIVLVAILLVSAVPFQASADTAKVGVAIKLTDSIVYQDKADIACGTVISTLLPSGTTMLTEYKKNFAAANEYIEFQGWVYTTGVKAGQAVNTSHVISADMANESGWVGIKAVFGYPTKNITLNADGGTVSSNTIAVTMGQTYPALPVPTRSGYSFNGWHTVSSDVRVDAGDVVNSYENLIAKWVTGTFTVTFQKWNGSQFVDATSRIYTITNGMSMKDMGAAMPTYNDSFGVRDGYTVDGWVDENGNAFTYETKITRDMKVRPNYVANTYTITYDYQCEELATKTQQVKFGSKVNLDIPSRANYVFLGWKMAHNGQELKTGDIYNYGDVTLIAQWAIKGTVELRVYRNDVDGFKTYTFSGAVLGEELDLNDCDIKDYLSGTYDFDGWFDYNGWVTYKATGSAAEITRIPYVATSNTANSTVTVIYGMVKNYSSAVSGGSTGNSGNSGTDADEPVDPSNPQTGDLIGVSLALMMSTGGAAVMLGKKRK